MHCGVEVFLTEMPDQPATDEKFRCWLEGVSKEERNRICRYRHWEDRYRALGATLLARHAVVHSLDCPPEIIRFRRTCFGRPYVVELPDYIGDFNVSHHARWVGCATVSVGRVGLDIVIPAEFTPSLIPVILSESEQKFVRSRPKIPEQTRLLAELWAVKEAYIKMLGTGLTIEPASIVFDVHALEQGTIRLLTDEARINSDSLFRLLEWSGDAVVAVCCEGEMDGLSVQRMDWEAITDADNL